MKVPEIHQPGHLFAPLWQISPADYGAVNVNLLSNPKISELYDAMLKAKTGVLSSNFQVGDMVRAPKYFCRASYIQFLSCLTRFLFLSVWPFLV